MSNIMIGDLCAYSDEYNDKLWMLIDLFDKNFPSAWRSLVVKNFNAEEALGGSLTPITEGEHQVRSSYIWDPVVHSCRYDYFIVHCALTAAS